MTGEEMCELIAAHWEQEYGVTVEPEAIWNYSPQGELWRVYQWYEQATQATNPPAPPHPIDLEQE